MSEVNQTNENDSNQQVPYNPGKRGSLTSWRGNKYPSLKLRGFYSDVTSRHNLEKTQVRRIFLLV